VEAAEAAKAAAEKRSDEAAHLNALQATREALRARAELTADEQRRVAEYLGRDAFAGFLRDCDNPQQAVAAGLIASGIRNAKEATKGMEKPPADKIIDAAERQQQAEQAKAREQAKEQARQQARTSGRSRERGFWLER